MDRSFERQQREESRWSRLVAREVREESTRARARRRRALDERRSILASLPQQDRQA